jgi:hypothetical protein
MSWRKTIPLLLLASNALAAEGYIFGFGVEGDTADGVAASVIGDLALTSNTWLTAAVARSTVDLPRRQSVDTWYADLGLDHWFDPVGIRVGAAYWGDSDILDSNDLRGSIYWRSDRVMLGADYEYRDFNFEIPPFNTFPGRTVEFDAHGIGLSARFDLSDNTSLSLHAMDYDYSLDLRIDDTNRPILDLLSFSRFSLINSLVDYDIGATLGLDAGLQRWTFAFSTWQGEVDGSTTNSATIRLMTPMGDKSDVEFGLGVDNSELYGTVTFLSVYLYFYGGT